MTIETVTDNKKRFLPLLLLGDEQESMIDRYLKRGEMFVMTDAAQQPVAVAVVTQENDGIAELKNIAVVSGRQRQGIGRQMIAFVAARYAAQCHTLMVGTGDSPGTLAFYQKCGFRRSHIIPRFFLDNYDHEIIEDGKLLVDMVYLKLDLSVINKIAAH